MIRCILRTLLPSAIAGACCIMVPHLASGQGQVASSQLPDVGGLRPGVPLAQAVAQLKAHDGKARLIAAQMIVPNFGDKSMPYALLLAQDMNASEVIVADVTAPPDAQMVWRISRRVDFPPNKQPLTSDLIAALRQKYGPESYAIPSVAPTLIWHYDESGRRAKEGNGLIFKSCTLPGQAMDSGWHQSVFLDGANRKWVEPPDPLLGIQPGCRNLVTIYAKILPGTDNAIATGLIVYDADFPLAAREYQKTIDAIRGDAEARRKRELEKAHQQATPSL